jgi:EAL domain-containing protein (putative c-di-GMP-specific phosphodiesterase class I)
MLISECKNAGQLITDISSGQPIAIELLARTKNIESLDMPTLFSLVERSALVEWVGHQVKAAHNILEDFPQLKVHINLDKSIINDVRLIQILKSNNLDNIIFEITQLQGLPELDSINELRNSIPEIVIYLDDYDDSNSIESLLPYKFDGIKTDVSFLSEAQTSYAKAMHYESFCHIYRNPIIAEGIETYSHMKFLKDLGVNIHQGFYFHEPEMLEDLIKRMKGDPAKFYSKSATK